MAGLAPEQTLTADAARHPFVHEMFCRLAKEQPDAPAIASDRGSVTYAELDRRSNRIAAALLRAGIRKSDLVAVFAHDRQFVIECVLGILKAGGAFVPLAPHLPAARLDSLLAECAPAWALVGDDAHDGFSRLASAPSIRIVSLHFPLDTGEETFEPLPLDGNDLSYIFFTSGSTGKPKGIAGRLKGIDHFIRWERKNLELGPGCRVSQLMSPMFDAFLRDIFAPLCSGGTVCIPSSPDIVLDGRQLARWLAEKRITVTHMVPSVFRLMVNHCEAGNKLAHLRHVLLAGEPLLAADVKAWYAVVGPQGGRMVNMYGTSETTMAKFAYMIQESDQNSAVIPVGKPIQGTKALLLDEEGRVCPPGIVGEIYIRTPYRSLGYYGRPKLTDEVFVQNPFGNNPTDLVHKTGDLGRLREDGNFEVLGRKDSQIKIRGNRVELGEIEAALTEFPEVAQAAVVDREVGEGEKRLAAYLVARQGVEVNLHELRRALKERLPEYMVPTGWGRLETLPLTSNGKTDREALRQREPEFGGWTRSSREARTPAEEILCAIWEEVLKSGPVGVEDNFFELGGHSLLATQVVSRILAAFAVELPIQAVFEAPTVLAMAQRIEEMQQRGASLTIPPIGRSPKDASTAPPLSNAQQRLWFIDQLEPGQATYNIPAAVRIQGPLNVSALEKAVAEVVARHDTLRTHFYSTGGEPQQIVDADVMMELPVFDLSPMAETDREAEAYRLAASDARTPFDLGRAPLLRVRLLQLAAQDHILVMTMHHIVSDAWSIGILIREVSVLYRAFDADMPSPLPPLPIQYSDYSRWQREWLREDVLARQLEYWKNQLAAVAPLELPSDYSRPAARTYLGATTALNLPLELLNKLKALSRRQGASLYMTLLAAFQTLLYRYSGQEDIAVGTPIAGRRQPETEALIGFFINTLVMRTDLSGGPGFLDLLQRVKQVTLAAFAHQDLPFEKLVEALQPERHLSRAPLFQAAFALQNVPASGLDLGPAKLVPVPIDSGTAKFDLWMPLVETGNGLQGLVQYSTDLFAEGTIRRMIERFHLLLSGIVAAPEQPIAAYSLLSEEERREALGTYSEPSPRPCLHELFSRQAQRTPDAVAVVGQGRKLRYAELESQSNRLARYLLEHGVKIESRIGIAMDRWPELIVAQLGVLKAGCAYVPLDLDHPATRLQYIIEDAGIEFLLSKAEAEGRERLPRHGVRILCLDSDWEQVASCDDAPLPSRTYPENLAYVIYTSGSSGQPKAAMITHQAVSSLILDSDYIRLQSTDRVAQIANFSFDLSTFDVYGALLNGAAIVIFDKETILNPSELAQRIMLEKTTVAFIPTAVFNLLASDSPQCFAGFRYVLFGGEAADVRAVRSVLPHAHSGRLVNLYGPTEATSYCTFFPIHGVERRTDNISIGQATPNSLTLVLDEMMELTLSDIAGELYIGGLGLARGYLNRPDLTAERFVPHPFAKVPGERLYRTGDKVRRMPGGNLEFRGRVDFQVKIRGFRIELGEIEVALGECPGVRQVRVIAREDHPGDKRLVAYLVAAEETRVEQLRDALKLRLPDYMIPSAFILLPGLPLTPNGKLDVKALPIPERAASANYVAPRTPEEAKLAEIWSQVLRTERVGVEDNFFDLGGHSLLATQVVSRMQDVFGKNLPLRRLFEFPTIAGLAQLIRSLSEPQAGDGAQDLSLPPIERVNRAAGRNPG
jgi:amino acid adenylation domain-containing protein